MYFPPTILDCDHVAAPATTTELLGPALTVESFDTEELELANGTPFALAAGVFAQNLTRAHRMIKRITAGVVWVNTSRAVSPIAPLWRIRHVRP